MTASELLRKRVEASTQAQVARELGVSKTTVSQLLGGKYGASPAKLEARVMALYGGQSGLFICKHTGVEVTPLECASTYERAVAVGSRVPGNPITLRQYHACRRCEIRK
ncbi:MAG: helix-turn-helix domain-containing protein [Deltaproteobacteria bacterium]|jgi:DNA-binding transcriptional regulator YdaS (Cro superfamily)|nr:helix-turn-helix domain-containing protein [Deltaproteobacteria bacterium]